MSVHFAGGVLRVSVSMLLFVAMAGCKTKQPPPPAHTTAVVRPPALASPLPSKSLVVSAPEAPPISTNPESREPGLGVVLASKLNVRSAPKAAGAESVVGMLRCGDIVGIESVAGADGEWYGIRLDKLVGYSYGSYIVRLGPGGKVPLCQFSFLKKKKVAPRPEEDQAVAQHPQAAPLLDKEKDARPATAPESGQKVTDPSVSTSQSVVTTPVNGPGKVSPPASTASATDSASKAAALPSNAAAAVAAKSDQPAAVPPTEAPRIDPGRVDIMLGLHASRARPVAFPHQKHQSQFACFRCHHPVASTGGNLHKAIAGDANAIKVCHNCHQAVPQGSVRATSEDVFHAVCRDCHRTAGSKRAPTGCPDCHK